MKRLMILAVFLFSLQGVFAACTYTINSQSTSSFLNELPSINKQLQDCPVVLPSSAGFLLANGNTLLTIAMDSGTVEYITLTIDNTQISGISRSNNQCTQQIAVAEGDFDKLLQNKHQITPLVSQLFLDNRLQISGCGFGSKVRIFFAKLFGRGFLKRQAQILDDDSAGASGGGVVGGDSNCLETAPQAHPGYNQNQNAWDQYTAQTDGVCQTEFGRGAPDRLCVYTVQLSVSGNPYYLCWYNNDGSGPEAARPITPGGKPNNCFDTTYQAHQGYNQNQALWDSYAANTDGVCQTDERTGPPSGGNCVHTIQLSTGGIPYYLCFYDQ